MTEESNYKKYRGKCLQYCQDVIKVDPSLTLVRGHYYCPIWNTDEQHYWTVKLDGSIYDPTRLQFPSGGLGIYKEFSGHVECSECSKEILEDDATVEGRYTFCSSRCYGKFVGIF